MGMAAGSSASSVIDRTPAVISGRWGEHITVGDYLHTRAWMHGDLFETADVGRGVYSSEEAFWNDALGSRSFYETSQVLLEDFVVMDWVPRSPGRYHSQEGRAARDRAAGHTLTTTIEDRGGHSVLYDPYGKGAMIGGGVGCLRLAMKTIGGETFKLLSASTSGMAHAGVVVALRSSDYGSLAASIAERGGTRCTLLGELRYWNVDRLLPLGATVGIPRIYLQVSDIDPSAGKMPRLDATPAIVFKSDDGELPGNFYTFAHVDPADGSALERCVRWMLENYVEGLYNGRVLTDFDETTPRFAATACPLRDVLDPARALAQVAAPLLEEDVVERHRGQFYIESLNVERWELVSNITITGDGNVVGNNNQVVTTINRGLDRDGLRELGEAFALLRGEILQLDGVPEKTRNQAVRALEDAEEEAADENPDDEVIVASLERAKDVLGAAGETYDTSKAWVQRFVEAGKALAVVIPVAANYLPRLFV
jgi:hypothetical protein